MIPPLIIISRLLDEIADSNYKEQFIDFLKKEITAFAQSLGLTVDWEKELVCVPGLPNSCEDLTDWLKSASAKAIMNMYINEAMSHAFHQSTDWSCWAATALILKGIFGDNPEKDNEEAFFKKKMKRITTTQSMIDAANNKKGLFSNVQHPTEVAKKLNKYGVDKELDYEDSLFVYKEILWQDDLSSTDAENPLAVKWSSLRLCNFMFNSDPGKTGIPFPSNVDRNTRSDEFHIVFYAVLFKYGIVTEEDPDDLFRWPPRPQVVPKRAVKNGLLWPLAYDWFEKMNGFKVEQLKSREFSEQKLLDVFSAHGPFIMDTSIKISDVDLENEPLTSHYIIIIAIDQIDANRYSYTFINSASVDPTTNKRSVSVETINSETLMKYCRAVQFPRTIVHR